MPRIETYTSSPIRTTAQASASDFADTRNMQQAAQDLADVSGILHGLQVQKDTLDYTKRASALQLQLMQDAENINNSDLPEGETIMSAYQKNFENRVKDFQIPSSIRDKVQLDLEQMKANYAQNGMQEQARQAGIRAKSDWEESLTNAQNIVLMNPSMADAVEKQLKDASAALHLDDATKDALFVDGRNRIQGAKAEAIAKSNPSAFIAQAKAGKWNHLSNLDGYVNAAESKIKQAQSDAAAALNKQKALDDSRLSLSMELMQDASDTIGISKIIDEKEKVYGEIWANKQREALIKQSKSFIESGNDAARGATFASGEASLNPADEKDKKAFDAFYTKLSSDKTFTALPDADRANFLADMIYKANAIPKTLGGEIKSIGYSQDAKAIIQAADLIDRVSIKNPYLVKQMADEDTLNRISMITSRIRSGYSESEAIKAVDDMLHPNNAMKREELQSAIKSELKSSPTYFQDNAKSNFEHWYSRFPSDVITQNSLDFATAEYRMKWEDTYMKTRDKAQAEKQASLSMSDWGVSSVNNKEIFMKYPPERYYQIQGHTDTSWIREQAIDDVLEKSKLYTRKDLEDGLMIVSDPQITARTAGKGNPVYRLVMMKDGAIQYVDNNLYHPDIEKATQKFVLSAKQNKQKKADEIKKANEQAMFLSGGG